MDRMLIQRFINVKLRKISMLRWVLSTALVSLFSNTLINVYLDYTKQNMITPYFMEYIVSFLNNEVYICYILFFTIALLASDIFNPLQNSFEENVIMKFDCKQDWCFANICFAMFISVLIVLFCLFVNILLSQVYGMDFTKTFEVMQKLTFVLGNSRTPQISIAVSALLIMLRTISMIVLIFLVNLKSKLPLGVLWSFSISVIDTFFYSMFGIPKSVNILPIEHTRTLFTAGAYPPNIGQDVRPSYIISIIYWLAIIALLMLASYRTIAKKSFTTEYKF